MKEPVNIMCLFWVGKFRGRNFKSHDVELLLETVDKHMDRPYTFYCLTNNMNVRVPGVKIPLKHDWPGWWAKVELHRRDLPPGRTLYLDLDTHVIRSLQPILDYPGELVMFNTRMKNPRNPGIVPCYQAAVMLFTPGSTYGVYRRFGKDPERYMKRYRSEQDIMGAWIPGLPTFPATWMMKMGDLRGGVEPYDDTIIITGQPKDTDFRNPEYATWIHEMAR
jgi:hypothetical protein